MPPKIAYSIWFILVMALLIGVILFFVMIKFLPFNKIEATYVSSCFSIIIFMVKGKINTDKEMNKTKKEDEQRIIEYVDKGDKNVRDALQMHITESDKTTGQMMHLINSMDGKLDILIANGKTQ